MERMAVNEGEKNTLYIVDRKAVDKCRKGKRIWVKHKREEKKKMKMLFRVRVTDEQRDELMWLKWMQRDWRSVCCVNGLIMKTKNCCGCSESFVLLMHKRAKPSLHLCAPSECVREKERKNSCGMRAKCLAFLPPLSVACSLIPMMCLDLIYPQTESLHTLGAQHDSFLLSSNLKKIKKKNKNNKITS